MLADNAGCQRGRFETHGLEGARAMADGSVWGVHAGRAGEADALFLQSKVVALGWAKVGDLTRFGTDREALKSAVAAAYADRKPGAVPNYTGQLFRFANEVQPGDLLLYPSKLDRLVHIGKVTGGYRFDPQLGGQFPHHRPAEWLKAVPRTHFTQGALYEIGSAMTLFQVRNYADEFRAALEEKPAPPPVAKDETVALVVEDVEETTRDFVLKTLSQELKGHPLSGFVANLLETMEYHTRVSMPGPDGGVDIVAHRGELGFEPPIIKVQVKSGDAPAGQQEVQALYGTLTSNENGLFVSLGGFSPQAQRFAAGKTNLRLVGGDVLVDLVLAHYEELDPRYKARLPLKRVYIPETPPSDE